MLKRTANVSLVHRASLAGMESKISDTLGIKIDQYHDTVIYHALIQSGVHTIRNIAPVQAKSDYLGTSRIVTCSDRDYYNLLDVIQEMLAKHAVKGVPALEGSQSFTLSIFLTDLIYSLQSDAAMITVLSLPKVENFQGRVSPHILSAIGNLFSHLTPTEVLTPVPQLSVKASEVKVFEELIESQMFRAYSDAHSSLEHIRESEVATLNDVSVKAKSVWQRFSHTVDLRKLTLTLMPITKSVADKVLTGLPATVACLIADAFTKAAQQERRIVIYDYGRSHQDLLTAHYEKIWRLRSEGKG